METKSIFRPTAMIFGISGLILDLQLLDSRMKQFGEWIWPDRQIRLMDISDKADPPDSELKLADILTDVGVGPTKQVMENPLRHVSLQQVG